MKFNKYLIITKIKHLIIINMTVFKKLRGFHQLTNHNKVMHPPKKHNKGRRGERMGSPP